VGVHNDKAVLARGVCSPDKKTQTTWGGDRKGFPGSTHRGSRFPAEGWRWTTDICRVIPVWKLHFREKDGFHGFVGVERDKAMTEMKPGSGGV